MPGANLDCFVCHPSRRRRGSALAEFVLFLPFALFIIAMIFHFGVSMARKQRTIVAARYAADLRVRGLGDPNGEAFWVNPVSNNPHPRGQAYPDPQNHYHGLFDDEEVRTRFLTKVEQGGATIRGTEPGDGVQELREYIRARDMGEPTVEQTTRTFWEQPFAATNQNIGGDFDFGWHVYAGGARIDATYQPHGPYFEKLQGPIASHYYRESRSWAFPHPDMWWELTHSARGLSELQETFYEMTQDPRMGRTADAFFHWFRH